MREHRFQSQIVDLKSQLTQEVDRNSDLTHAIRTQIDRYEMRIKENEDEISRLRSRLLLNHDEYVEKYRTDLEEERSK